MRVNATTTSDDTLGMRVNATTNVAAVGVGRGGWRPTRGVNMSCAPIRSNTFYLHHPKKLVGCSCVLAPREAAERIASRVEVRLENFGLPREGMRIFDEKIGPGVFHGENQSCRPSRDTHGSTFLFCGSSP